MSRIVIQRHSNGEEQLVAGYDHPLATAFVDMYDETGEAVWSNGPLSGERLDDLDVVRILLNTEGVSSAVAGTVGLLVAQHKALEYPESNVVVDISAMSATH